MTAVVAPREVPASGRARLLAGPYGWLLAAQGASGTADQAVTVACALWVARSPGAVALMAACGSAAAMISGPAGGLAADRFGRRRVMASTEAFRAAVAGLLAVAGLVPGLLPGPVLVPVLCAVIALVQAAGQAFAAARLAVTSLWFADDSDGGRGWARASSAGATVTAVADVAGPAAVVPLALTVSVPAALGAVAAAYGLSVLAVAALPSDPGNPSPAGRAGSRGRVGRELAAGLAEGLRAFRSSPVLPRLAVVTFLAQLGIGALLALTLAMVTGPLQSTAGGYGLATVLAGAGLAAGSLAGGRVTARWGPRTVTTACLATAGVLTGAFAASHTLPAALTALTCWWVTVGVAEVAALPLLLGSVPSSLLGRASSLFRMVNKAAVSVAALAAGRFTSDPVPAVAVSGVLIAASGVLAALVLPGKVTGPDLETSGGES